MGLLEEQEGKAGSAGRHLCLLCVRGHGSFESVFGCELKFVVLFGGK